MGNPDLDWHRYARGLGEFSIERQESLEKHYKAMKAMVEKKMSRAWQITRISALKPKK